MMHQKKNNFQSCACDHVHLSVQLLLFGCYFHLLVRTWSCRWWQSAFIVFSHGHATLHFAMSVGQSVGPFLHLFIRPSIHLPQALSGLESAPSGLEYALSGQKSAFSGIESALSGLKPALSIPKICPLRPQICPLRGQISGTEMA